MNGMVRRDEREEQIDHAADRLAYVVVSYGLLLLVAYRSLARNEASWDLLGLVVVGGAVGVGYRLWRHAVSVRWAGVAAVTAVLGLAIAAVIVLVRGA